MASRLDVESRALPVRPDVRTAYRIADNVSADHRQPLRFLLADDPDDAKTIMAGLFMKELAHWIREE